ncbi:MAG: MFS transporter [Candidatus Binataceae bacterium]
MQPEEGSAIQKPPHNADAIRSITIRYYVASTCYVFGPLFTFAVLPLFLQSRGLDQFQINMVTAVFVLITFLTDVPTGAFADAVGRRSAVVVGCALQAAAFLIYFLSHHYRYFIVAAAVAGLGTTFGNGPIDAWAVDALDAAGFQGAKDALFSRKFQLGEIAGMCGALSGAYIAQVNIAAPFLATAIVWIATGMVAIGLMDRGTGRRRSLGQMTREIRRRSINSTRLGFADRNVRLLSIAGMISALLWYGWGQEWQQYFKHGFHSGIGAVGWVSVAIIAAQIAGLELAARMPRAASAHRAAIIGAMTTLACAALIVAGLAAPHIWLALASVMLATFVMGVVGPMGFAWYNEVIAGENRATLLSFGSTMSTLGGIIGLPVQGKLVDAFGTGIAWQIAGLVSMTQVLCYVALGRTHHAPEGATTR